MRAPRDDANPRPAIDPRLGRIHDRILAAVALISAGEPAEKALAKVYAKARDLGSRERARVGEVVYGLQRRRLFLDDQLERAAGQNAGKLERVEPPLRERLRVLALMAAEGQSLDALQAADRYAAGRIPGLFERLVAGKLGRSKKSKLEQLATELALPPFLLKRLLDAYGEDRARVIGEALQGRAPVTLRAKSETERDRLLCELQAQFGVAAERTKLSPLGINLRTSVDLGKFAPFLRGELQLQDEGSQLIALAAQADPGEALLDACAGAGGKSLALWAISPGKRRVAMDPEAAKLGELKRRAAKAGISGIDIQKGDLTDLPADMVAAFDVVLVDAPCTATGTLRRHPDLRWRLQEADIALQTGQQRRLIGAAIRALKPGGRLIYATCSILPDENEGLTQSVLVHEKRLQPLALSSLWGEKLSNQLAATHEAHIGPGPGALGPDGFYVAAYRFTSILQTDAKAGIGAG